MAAPVKQAGAPVSPAKAKTEKPDWRTAGTLRSALIWSEVMGKPLALRGKKNGR